MPSTTLLPTGTHLLHDLHAGGLALQRHATATGWSRAAEMFHRFVVVMQSQLSDTDPLLDFSDPCASPSLPRDVRLGNHGRPTLGVPPWSPVQNACASSLQASPLVASLRYLPVD